MPSFRKKDRLRAAKEFERVRIEGERVGNDAVVFSVMKSERQRLGLVVGGSVGNSVVRNRIKRVIRDFFRVNRGLFPTGDCVMIAKPKAAMLTNSDLRKKIEDVVRKMK